MTRPSDEDFLQTDDHEFIAGAGWKWRPGVEDNWEPACCHQRPWMWPQRTYCGYPERFHRMRMLRGPVLIRKDADAETTNAS